MFERLNIPDVFLFTPKRHVDSRGWFAETFNLSLLEPMTGKLNWVQDNQSHSVEMGVVRGLHFQIAPFAQDKLVRCIQGEVVDVAVDIRRGSPTYGRHVKTVLSAENGRQIFIPKGFAHGCITLSPNSEILYKVTNYYSSEHDHGLLWNDPDLGIDWGPAGDRPALAERDKRHPRLADLPPYFNY